MSDNWWRAIIAVVAVIVGFVLKEVADQLRDRKKVKRLTYSMNVGSTLTDVPQKLAQKVSVRFGGLPVEGQVYEVTCRVENTGHLVVKEEYLRFSFPERCQILEAYVLGDPPLEYGIKEAPLEGQADVDQRWVVAHLERRQSVSFGFLVAGPTATAPQLFGHNDEGDVELNPKGRTAEREDASHVRPLLTYVLLSFLVPVLPSYELGEAISGLVRLVLLLLTIPHLYPVGRVLAAFLTRADELSSTTADIMISHTSAGGDITIASRSGDLSVGTSASRPEE
ncbi:hypothetical protein [Nocardia lijiangensis]|uniref:hypothetical protein n=1 Tax=Nocardia lijiangensis TaxID=299618 RepID=UPI0008307131|nr:hypothetical protein [Nocardia lijiangensis]